MLKWIVSTAIITVIITVVITWKAKSCEAPNKQSQPATTAQPLASPMLIIAPGKNGNAEQEQPQNQTRRTSSYANSYFCNVVSPANLPTIYLVLIGFGGIVVAISTLKAIERQADTMEKALKVVEAADVGIESASLVPVGAITPDSHIGLKLKNFGRTRAQNVQSSIVIIIPGVPDSEPAPGGFSIGPGGTQIVRFLKFRDFMTQDTFLKIQAGNIAVRFRGDVMYEDRFGGTHAFPCKGILDPKTGMFILGDTYPGQKDQQDPN